MTEHNGTVENFHTGDSGDIGEVFLPVGAGVKFAIARGINLDLGYTVYFAYSDNLDGFNFGSTNDRFSYTHVGLEFALGSASKPQLATHNPVSSMRQEYMMENQNTPVPRLKASLPRKERKTTSLLLNLLGCIRKLCKINNG